MICPRGRLISRCSMGQTWSTPIPTVKLISTQSNSESYPTQLLKRQKVWLNLSHRNLVPTWWICQRLQRSPVAPWGQGRCCYGSGAARQTYHSAGSAPGCGPGWSSPHLCRWSSLGGSHHCRSPGPTGPPSAAPLPWSDSVWWSHSPGSYLVSELLLGRKISFLASHHVSQPISVRSVNHKKLMRTSKRGLRQ